MNEQDFSKSRYTHRDYESTKKDLLEAVPSLTQKWTALGDSSPGTVLIKLISMMADNLSYNFDKSALEMYIDSVTQRKNCDKILSLIGYKMRWYRAARLTVGARIPSTSTDAVLTTYKSTIYNNDKTYTVIGTKNNLATIGAENLIVLTGQSSSIQLECIEGTVSTIGINKTEVSENKFYLPVSNIDDTHIWLKNSEGQLCGKLVDDLSLITDDYTIYYELKIDEYDKPYLQFMNNWETIDISASYSLSYIVTSGSKGNVAENTLLYVGNYEGNAPAFTLVNPDNNNPSLFGVPGQDPESVEEAVINAKRNRKVVSTLVTVADFENLLVSLNGIEAAKCIDKQFLKENPEIRNTVFTRADDTTELIQYAYDTVNTTLKPYALINYVVYDEYKKNKYCTDQVDPQFKLKPVINNGFNTTHTDYFDTANQGIANHLQYYPYKPVQAETNKWLDATETQKCIQIEQFFGTTKVYPFLVSGLLYTSEQLSPQETIRIIDLIDEKLKEAFAPDKIDFFEQPNLLTIGKVINGIDPKVVGFAPSTKPIQYMLLSGPNDPDVILTFDKTTIVEYVGLAQQTYTKPVYGPNQFDIIDRKQKYTIKFKSIATEVVPSYTQLLGPGGLSGYENYKYQAINLGGTYYSGDTLTIVCDSIAKVRTLVYHLDTVSDIELVG